MGKRKLPDQLVASKKAQKTRSSSSHMALMTDIAVELMELNAEKLRLLRLPEEIRRMIWQEVIGHTVHMEYHRPIHFEDAVKEWLHYHGSVPKQGLSCHGCFARTLDDGYYCESQKYDHNRFQASGAPRYDMFVGDN